MSTPEKFQLVITFYPRGGRTEVDGPIDNKPLCYSMLELARDAVQNFNQKDEETRKGERPRLVIPKEPGLPPRDGS